MTRDHFESAFDIVPERNISSLYDVSMLYVACDMYEKLSSDFIDWDLSPEALRAMTPNKTQNLLKEDADESFIAVQVDLSGESPQLGEPPVVVENYTQDIVFKVGHMYWNQKAGKKTDYSISNYTGSNKKEVSKVVNDSWGNRFLRARLDRWPFCDEAEAAIENGEDENGILQGLRTLGSDSDILDRIEDEAQSVIDSEKVQAIIGVKIKTEEAGPYRYPAEVPILNKVALDRMRNHLERGLSVSDAVGDGVGYVSNEESSVWGGTPGVLKQYSKKKIDRFPNLSGEDAWLSHPLSEEAAIAISTADPVLEQFAHKINGVRAYYLPYPSEPMTIDVFERFYTEVYSELSDSNNSIKSLYNILVNSTDSNEGQTNEEETSGLIESLSREGWLHVYGLLYVADTDPPRIIIEEPNVSLNAIVTLSDNHDSAIRDLERHSVFGSDTDDIENSVFSPGIVPSHILSGKYLSALTSKTPDVAVDEESKAGGTMDDVKFRRDARVLMGETISMSSLLDGYVTKLSEIQRSLQSGGRGFPTYAVVAQYAQWVAIEQSGLIEEETEKINLLGLKHGGMKDFAKSEAFENRDERLNEFLSSHDALDTPEARATFLLGGLVGRLSAYQRGSVSQSLIDQHPISSVNRRSIQKITSKVIQKNETYASRDNHPRMNERYTSRLDEAMLKKPPEEWEAMENELKWYYSLGIAYGKSDSSVRDS